MKLRAFAFAVSAFLVGIPDVFGAPGTPDDYLHFIQAQAAALRDRDRAPATVQEWTIQKTALRKELLKAWGGFPENPAPLQPRILGKLERDGYAIERLVFQTFPGVWMTANAYVPKRQGKLPAILMVHGHWRGAKQDPVVQARCIGAAKLGFFVLVVDAFGAGERAIGRALGEYHGDMTAATLLPTGLPLSGVQVYENMRAVDYLQQRPEVNPEKIGISGASGGGNQSMYAGGWDERFGAVSPVCSVGNYQAYLGAACCMCEVVPGALRFAEEWGLLGMVAPRGLLVINATRDARQFSVEEAKKSLALAKPIFELLGKASHLRHTTFESGHDYSQPMREAVYGWMTFHLKGEGDGTPIPEPATKPEDPETLRCFPGDSRPDDWITLPKFAAAEGRRILKQKDDSKDSTAWQPIRKKKLDNLEALLGGFPEPGELDVTVRKSEDRSFRDLTFSPEPGITLTARHFIGKNPGRLLVVVDFEPGAKQFGEAGNVVRMDLRATGPLARPGDKVGRALDHTAAQWGLWIGRPLLGQWVWDLRRLLDAIQEADGTLPPEITIVGVGPGGVVALAAAALDPRITRVASAGMLASLVTEVPYEGQRLGIIVPGILRDLGDIPHLAALVAPRPLFIDGGVTGGGSPLTVGDLNENYSFTKQTYSRLSAERSFRLVADGHEALDQFLGFE